MWSSRKAQEGFPEEVTAGAESYKQRERTKGPAEEGGWLGKCEAKSKPYGQKKDSEGYRRAGRGSRGPIQQTELSKRL